MPKYLIEATYSSDGIRGVQEKGGSARRDAVAAVVEGMGGSLEAFYFAFGDPDVYAIIDLPDNEAAAAVGMAVNASGLVRAGTTVLLTPAEVDSATGKSVGYQPPGS
ncbi:MAG: GYD domain-containing protein [Solirubrobacterales bacterium]